MKTETTNNGLVTLKTWRTYKKEVKQTRHMQNDGKHIALFKMFVLKNFSFSFYLGSFICRFILKKKFGKNYAR